MQGQKEYDELEKKIEMAKMPELIEKKIQKELSRLKAMSPMNPEAPYIQNYVDFLVDLPWSIGVESEEFNL